MATVIVERRPSTSEDLIEFWTLIAFGSTSAIRQRYGMKARMRDRLAAASELANRLHGRPVQAIEFDEPVRVPAFALPPGTTGVSPV